MTRLAIAILCLLLVGCKATFETPNPSKPGTPELSRTAGQHLSAAEYSATEAKANLPAAGAEKSAAHLDTAIVEIKAASEAVDDVTTQAERDTKAMMKALEKIKDLEKKDPLVVGLNWLAVGLIVVGGCMFALHWVWLKIPWGDDAGAACLITGAIVGAVAWWLPTIRIVVLIVALGAGIFAAFRAWREYRKSIAGAVLPAISEANRDANGA